LECASALELIAVALTDIGHRILRTLLFNSDTLLTRKAIDGKPSERFDGAAGDSRRRAGSSRFRPAFDEVAELLRESVGGSRG
jgi:hypothetical protein